MVPSSRRGAMVTSADAAVRFRRADGLTQLTLIEWKYTESYRSSEDYSPEQLPLAGGKGEKRLQRNYREIFGRLDGPLLPERCHFESLFFEPLYQLMRQQMLAHEMERNRELCADVVTVLHVSPAHNHALQAVTAEELPLRYPDVGLGSLWPGLLRPRPDGIPRFRSVSTGVLFGDDGGELKASLGSWWAYVSERYSGALRP